MLAKAIFFVLMMYLNESRAIFNQNLGGEWLIKGANGKYVDVKAAVPGGIFTDLTNNDIIEDPLFGDNDLKFKWIGWYDWSYYRNFTVNNSLLDCENVNLVFEGLDTITTIYLNNKIVKSTDNMFVRYVVDVKDVLQVGSNYIEVYFHSPVNSAKAFADKDNLPVPPECPVEAQHGECHINQLRKMQASFSWDWGPSIASMGIWKDVYLEAFNSTKIRYVTTLIWLNSSDTWNLNIRTYFANSANNTVTGKLLTVLVTDVNEIDAITEFNQSANDRGEIVFEYNLLVPKSFVQLWWPNGYGEAKLYPLKVIYTDSVGSAMDVKSLNIGFRTVELIQDNSSVSKGLTFYFKINDIPIFAKGSNLIPLDVRPEKGQNQTKIDNLLKTAKESHMNMIRIWGGGVYESDALYEKADQLGIMIWQDFMFACAMYPVRDDFLKTVTEEVNHQYKRLGSHPSIVIWAGNNENEAALATDWYDTSKNQSAYLAQYKKLYFDTIQREFERLSKSSLFLSSSPTNGDETLKEGGVAKNPYSLLYGDLHFYSYVLNSFNANIYPISRFASEFGYQSLPSLETLRTAISNESDLNVDSAFFTSRQHHTGGNLEMPLLISYQFELPPKNDSLRYLKTYIYYSQIIQAMSIKIETEVYRSWKNHLNDEGQGFTMGALYWQLNDVWVAPTWSGIDFTGRWKMLQYYTKSFFSPIIITGYVDALDQLNVYVVSDNIANISNVTATLSVYNWTSFMPLNETMYEMSVDMLSSKNIATFDVTTYLTSVGCGSLLSAKSNCFFYLTLKRDTEYLAPNNFVFPRSLKKCNVVKPNIQISSIDQVSGEDNTFEIHLKTDQIAPFVWLDSHDIDGRFSDNGILLISENYTATFTAEHPTTVNTLRNSLTITNLLDTQ